MTRGEAFELMAQVELSHANIVADICLGDANWLATASHEALMREYYKLHGASMVVVHGSEANKLLIWAADTVWALAQHRGGY